MSLIIISPHREEIRDEVEHGFAHWLREETNARTARAGTALTAWLAGPSSAEAKREVETAFQAWLRHWSPAHRGEVRQALEAWQSQPTHENARRLSAALERWTERWRDYDIQLEWRDIGGGTSQIVRYLTAQYQTSPDGVGIDILYGGGTDIYLDFKNRRLLERFGMPEELRQKLRPDLFGVELYDQEGHWHGAMLSSLGILSNREVLDRIGLGAWSPGSWKDLGDERLLGWVSAGDPRMSGSVHMLYELILQTYGWEEGFGQLTRLGANARGFARFSDSVTRDVVLGKAAAGGSLDSYAFSALTREQTDVQSGKVARSSLEFVLPKGETLLNPDSIGILKGAPHRELAEAFVEFNLSEEGGQRLWMLRPGTLPGSPRKYSICRLGMLETMYDVERYPSAVRSVQINPFDAGQVGSLVPYSNQQATKRWNALNDLFGAWIVDTHDDLHAAWAAVVRCRGAHRAALEKKLFAPPCSETELQDSIIPQLRKGPRERADLISRWLDEAGHRHRAVRAEAQAAKR